MNKNRLGCLTGTGVIAALITVFVLVGVVFASGGQMFSSGDLNTQQGRELGGVTAHAQIQECGACHVPFWGREVMAERCIQCHTEIAAQMLTVAELHGIITHQSPALACRDCHPEHRGKTASLTELGKNEFPHNALGYSLEGHQRNLDGQPFECADCHSDDITTFASDSCLTCHRQVDMVYAQTHLLSFGSDCLACHDGVDSYGDAFDHNRFTFPLAGKHTEVDCGLCHINARKVSDLRAAPQDCYFCHQVDDAHGGEYGTTCESCHSPEGWTPATFDHNLSAFKLDGAHANVECESCHKNGVYKGAPKECVACHAEPSEHFGQFGTDCSACHTTSTWAGATFDHNLSVFKLTGAHVSVACASCHQNGLYKGAPQDCYSCHRGRDKHNGRFGTNCAACHTTSIWKGATFNHNLSNFPLTGDHASLACTRCHVNGQYSGISSACVSCHAEPAYHAGIFGTNCAGCHNTSNWSATYTGPHPGIADEGGYGVNHGHTSCRTCHTSSFGSATCTACHDGNEGGEGEDGDGGDDDDDDD